MCYVSHLFTFYIDTTLILVIFISPVCDGFSQHPKSRHFGIQATARQYGHALVNTPTAENGNGQPNPRMLKKFVSPWHPSGHDCHV
jgi:hypothetical protein